MMRRNVIRSYHKNQHGMTIVTVDPRFYALLLAMFWCLVQCTPEMVCVYAFWHTLSPVTERPWETEVESLRRTHQELWTEYQQIMMEDDQGQYTHDTR